MQIPTTAVNGDTWNSELQRVRTQRELKILLCLTSNFQGLVEDLFQGILTSPEMCLKHAEFRKILTQENFSKNICAVIIDEAHCISQWGGDF
jgi:superfamily II DNA helicase RecQ